MYDIRPESVKTFISDKSIKLPRFQRKQTWDDKKNFQLCISIFKDYPIGVCILSLEKERGKIFRSLLDGRQRRNALLKMYEDPENIYTWARKFIGFKNSDQPSELEEKFREKILEYIEADTDEDIVSSDVQIEDDSPPLESPLEDTVSDAATGLELLLEIIKLIHNKQKKNTGFTKPFDFTQYVDRLPYLQEGTSSLSSRLLTTFIREYQNYLSDHDLDFEAEESFFTFLDSRSNIKNPAKVKSLIHEKWTEIRKRILILDKIENQLSLCKIGMIEVSNLSPSDSQKIFNIINSEGEKLKAVEILSAKPHWNIPISNPSQGTVDIVSALYKELGTTQIGVVRWDLPATLLRRIGGNCVIKQFNANKTDFVKELTCGFKILAGIYEGGVKKEDIEKLSRSEALNWDTDFDNLVYDLKNMFNLLTSFDYFKYFKSWRSSIFELTSEAVAINFFIIAYKDWARKGKPVGNDQKAKQFQKNCFILWDKLIYEYIYKQWRGAADGKTAGNISDLARDPDAFTPVEEQKWLAALNEIFDDSSIDSLDISQAMMEPLLYHMYCMKRIQAPDTSYEIEVDHIIPQALFGASFIERRDVLQHNVLNLGLLPKNENASKNKKKLILIESDWLKDEIARYEFIPKERFQEFSSVNNYKAMFQFRKPIFIEAYTVCRQEILNN